MPDITVRIISEHGEEFVPAYQTEGAAGMDIRAGESGEIEAGAFKLVKTGLRMAIPAGYEAQIRPRSGLALKQGVTVLNSPGTIDSDYRGEVGIILINHSRNTFRYEKGDRIAQAVFAKVTRVSIQSADTLDDTERSSGGFGHSGVR
ncbi:dUTP diphosphatase [Geovibrio ferrireducens]|uniref:dUTP diphosphatase n=1 Tax=Geovibrio ferrireducens TaxID=46201 RepID=UPI002246DBC7|nr:dUTP diphosphatase [Geovibrio ferrireducens]